MAIAHMLNELENCSHFKFDYTLAEQLLKYARLIAKRQLVYNTFGNIAIRGTGKKDSQYIYTKHRGISLEEMEIENIVVTDLYTDSLVHGEISPSVGHQMHREIFKCREEVNAVIHLHPNDVIAYFSTMHCDGMKYVSNDTALVMGMPVKILEPDVNIELDVSPIKNFIKETNCIVMPHHGITTCGRTISEAYNRAISFASEATRLVNSYLVATANNRKINFVDNCEIEHMYKISDKIIYG